MLVDAGTFAAVALAAWALRVKRPPDEVAEGEQSPRARDGIACLFRDSTLAGDDAIGPRGTLAYAGSLSALAGLVGLLALLRLRQQAPAAGPA